MNLNETLDVSPLIKSTMTYNADSLTRNQKAATLMRSRPHTNKYCMMMMCKN